MHSIGQHVIHVVLSQSGNAAARSCRVHRVQLCSAGVIVGHRVVFSVVPIVSARLCFMVLLFPGQLVRQKNGGVLAHRNGLRHSATAVDRHRMRSRHRSVAHRPSSGCRERLKHRVAQHSPPPAFAALCYVMLAPAARSCWTTYCSEHQPAQALLPTASAGGAGPSSQGAPGISPDHLIT